MRRIFPFTTPPSASVRVHSLKEVHQRSTVDNRAGFVTCMCNRVPLTATVLGTSCECETYVVVASNHSAAPKGLEFYKAPRIDDRRDGNGAHGICSFQSPHLYYATCFSIPFQSIQIIISILNEYCIKQQF